jgi:hypothetical protein
MTALTSDTDSVRTWVTDFRACLRGEHGSAWRSRAECEVRAQNSGTNTPIHVAALARSWRRVREEFVNSSDVG